MNDIQQGTGTDPTASADRADSVDERPRGRHRRRRPRTAVLVAGGLVLAAGALSLVRLAPETGVPGLGTAEAEPRHRTGEEHATGRSTAVPTAPVPKASPSATDVMGAAGPLPPPSAATATASSRGPATGPVSTPAGASEAPGSASTAPTSTPSRSAPAPRPSPDPTTAPAPRPPQPPQPTPTPTPQPDEPDDPGLCVPILHLCLDLG
ncbi:hypothetical protein [Streptomyces griseosporeus]|uniref:hypothetical protein n=1 Tax=Streptomyces griseosporeus TaxID=1910 RepID=UPI0036F5CAF8